MGPIPKEVIYMYTHTQPNIQIMWKIGQHDSVAGNASIPGCGDQPGSEAANNISLQLFQLNEEVF